MQGGWTRQRHRACSAPNWSLVPIQCHRYLIQGEGGGLGPEQQSRRACWHLQAQFPGPKFKERRRGGAFSQGTAAGPMITCSPPAGGVYKGFGNYYNHLLCWAETDPVSLCFRALKAREARRSQFQHKRPHNSSATREETSLLAIADQFFPE